MMATLVMNPTVDVFVPHHEGADHHLHRTGSTPGDSSVPQLEEKYVCDGEILTFPGPLMSAKMQKEELMRFIQGKCQELLLHLDKPEQQKSYFFWLIMERFCNRSGRLMMAEIATLLFKGYGLLRRKLGRVEDQEDWCLPLAKLLCSAAPRDNHSEEIVKLGDEFAFRGLTYAAQICHVGARLELGSRRHFQLIGCDSLPDSKSALREVMERTEVYEYVLSLTSGFGQPAFQKFKFIQACELGKAGLCAQALDYCQNIAEEVLRLPECHQSPKPPSIMEKIIMLYVDLLEGKKEEKPKWLRKLCRLLKASQGSAHLEFHPSQHSEFESRYTVGELLGTARFGSVYAGVRRADGKQVTIKCVVKGPYDDLIRSHRDMQRLPLEVVVMEMVSRPPRCENVVEMLEWFETSTFFILVLDRPYLCMDLRKFCDNHRLLEFVAQRIMQQVVGAARHCCDHGVLHHTFFIKSENILINPNTFEVKLMDFGCSELLTDELHRRFAGTEAYWSPEWVLHRDFSGVPATIWGLGVFLFHLVSGHVPFGSHEEIVHGRLSFSPDLSPECCDLIMRCLNQDPKSRPTFQEILNHKWFNLGRQEVQTPPADQDLITFL